MKATQPLAAAAVGVVALLAASNATAHATLVSASPAANAAGPTPARIVLRFSEKLTPRFSSFTLTSHGAAVPMRVVAGPDRHTLVGSPGRRLAPGLYRVAWRAVATDSHAMRGTYAFAVR